MKNAATIASCQVLSFDIPLNTSFAISKGALQSAKNVLVIFKDDNGLIGVGEAAPFPVLTGDFQDIAFETAEGISRHLVGLDPTTALDDLYKKLWKDYKKSQTARTAVEMALWDLRARQLGVPVAWLWGVAGVKKAHSDITVPIMDASEVPAFWERFQTFGFSMLKIKVGIDSVQADVDRIAALRDIVPPATQFSLDGNQGCSVTSALDLLDKLEDLDIKPLFFEQPLPANDWDGMIKLTEKSPIPICADETVVTAFDAVRLVREKAAHMINLKIMKSGILETLRIISVARSAGLELMIGGMVESEVAMTASLHMLCGTGEIQWCDLDTPFFFTQPLTDKSPYTAKTATLYLPQGTGFGLELKREYLR